MHRAAAPAAAGRSLGAGGPKSRRQFVRSVAGLGVSAAGLALLAGCGVPAFPAPQPTRVPRIGYLALGAGPSPLTEAFRQGLREHGYVEGQNLTIEYRWAAGREERLPDLAADLVGLRVDLLVAVATEAVRAAKGATTTIPIVIAASSDPVGTELVASLARPGGNVTGLTLISPELSAKRLELLKDVVPEVSRVAVLANPTSPARALDWRETQLAAQALGVQLLSLEVQDPSDIDSAFEAATRERAEALIAFPDGLLFSHRARIVDLAAKSRLPAMYGFREFAAEGGLMAYGPNLPDLYRRAASYVDRILRGARPADLPVERPTRFELILNLKTAQSLGLTLPQSVLIQADELVQ